MSNTLNAKIQELESRKKKFLPANIVAFLLSVIAIVSLLVMPLISFDFGTLLGSMSAPSGDEDDSSSDAVVFEKILNDSMGDSSFSIDFKFFDIFTMINGEFQIGDIAKGAYEEGGIIENMLLYTNAANSLGKIVDFTQVSEETIKEIDLSEIVDTISLAETDISAAKTAYVEKVIDKADSLGFQPEEGDVANIESDFDEMITKGTPEGGIFSVEYYVCTTSSDGEATTYEELEAQMSSTTEGSSAADSASSSMQEMNEIFSIVGFAILGVVGLSILLWFLLALISFIKMFRENKCFHIWYVAVFAHLPFMLFFVLFKVLNLALGETLGEAALILGSITSMTWIMGICWGALILFSFFFNIPKRRKIKKLGREIEQLKIKAKQEEEKALNEIVGESEESEVMS